MCDTSHSEVRIFLTCWPRESTTCPGILFRYRPDTLYLPVRVCMRRAADRNPEGWSAVSAIRKGKVGVRDSHSNDGRKSYFRHFTTATIFEYNNAISSPTAFERSWKYEIILFFINVIYKWIATFILENKNLYLRFSRILFFKNYYY